MKTLKYELFSYRKACWNCKETITLRYVRAANPQTSEQEECYNPDDQSPRLLVEPLH